MRYFRQAHYSDGAAGTVLSFMIDAVFCFLYEMFNVEWDLFGDPLCPFFTPLVYDDVIHLLGFWGEIVEAVVYSIFYEGEGGVLNCCLP